MVKQMGQVYVSGVESDVMCRREKEQVISEKVRRKTKVGV